jgi:hypothetical protein
MMNKRFSSPYCTPNTMEGGHMLSTKLCGFFSTFIGLEFVQPYHPKLPWDISTVLMILLYLVPQMLSAFVG